MYEERLLERIARLEDPYGPGRGTDISRAVGSIIRHLRRMLNTRQGSVPIAEDYGVPDMTNFPSLDLAGAGRDIAGAIRDFIRAYEPRLDKVRIEFERRDENMLSLRFRLEGVLSRESKMPVMFETVVDSDGKVNVMSEGA
jgi:type VI secretion system protein